MGCSCVLNGLLVRSTVKEVGIKECVLLEFVQVVVLWWVLVLLKSQMAWEVSVMGIMNVVSSVAELIWVVEPIELISRSLNVVLDTVAIEVVNSSLAVEVLLGPELEEGHIL